MMSLVILAFNTIIFEIDFRIPSEYISTFSQPAYLAQLAFNGIRAAFSEELGYRIIPLVLVWYAFRNMGSTRLVCLLFIALIFSLIFGATHANGLSLKQALLLQGNLGFLWALAAIKTLHSKEDSAPLTDFFGVVAQSFLLITCVHSSYNLSVYALTLILS